MDEPPNEEKRDQFSIASKAISIITVSGYVAILISVLISTWNSIDFRNLVMQHFTVIVGLPTAGLFAFVIVSLFESSFGNIKFDALGIKFSGASGPIILWILTFLAIVASIKILW